MKKVLKIATRKSPLALWQAEYVKARLEALHPDLEVVLVKMVTEGDKILDVPLAKIGGKGLFIKELEQGMLAGDADIAVHSMKDVPMEMPEGFRLSVICERENPFDAFVSNDFANIMHRHEYLKKYKQDVNEQEEKTLEAEQKKEEQRERLIKSVKDRKILDKDKENKRKVWKKVMNREETKFLDDLSVSRTFRQKQESQ